MPLPAVSERAANTVARELARMDQAATDHIETGAPLPAAGTVMRPIVTAVRQSVTAALNELGGPVTARMIDDAVADVVTLIDGVVRTALADARRARRRIPSRAPDVEKQEPTATLIKRFGAGGALLALLARRPRRQRTPDVIRAAARRVGIKAPRATSAYGRMVVRTETAVVRNDVAADIVDAANESDGPRWAIFVRDGRNGPTDHACERVDSKWATAAWLRQHRVEHPNCTRLGMPRPLPEDATVTLLR